MITMAAIPPYGKMLVVGVSGAKPDHSRITDHKLWKSRRPPAMASGAVCVLLVPRKGDEGALCGNSAECSRRFANHAMDD
jgi:hypothetical protein